MYPRLTTQATRDLRYDFKSASAGSLLSELKIHAGYSNTGSVITKNDGAAIIFLSKWPVFDSTLS